MDQPNYYAIIPANVRYDENLKPNAKLLYGEITALCTREGFCWASNDYFADLYNVSTETISRWISQLSNGGYLVVQIHKKEGNKRQIFLQETAVNLLTKKSIAIDKKINRVLTKKSIAIDKKSKSNIRMNNTISNTSEREDFSLSFLQNNYPSDYEILMMQFQKQINDFEKFVPMFEATVQQEKLEFDRDVIVGRFKKYALNWISNQNKFDNKVIELNPNQKKEKIGGF